MMERLTFEGNFCDIALCAETPGGSFCESGACSQRNVWERLKAYEDAEEQGRLVVLPCKVGDTVYVVGASKIVECEIGEALLCGTTGPEFLVTFVCDTCDGCPFNSWAQEYSGEWSCGGEYGDGAIKGTEFGKTVFLTREEAEAALKDGGGNV